jgi:hypothetical protein
MRERHQDVAAYALGVLEPEDAYRFEEHLAECVSCAVRLSDFAFTAASLADIASAGSIDARPSPRLLERLTDEVAVARRRSGRRRLRLVAVAAALIVALPVATVALQDLLEPQGQQQGQTQQIAAKDARTGVTASATTEKRAWGTAVSLRLTGLTGPGKCRLFVIGKDGIERPVLNWAVPTGGYGIEGAAGHEEPLDIAGGTDMQSGDIGGWEVRTADGQPLVTLK